MPYSDILHPVELRHVFRRGISSTKRTTAKALDERIVVGLLSQKEDNHLSTIEDTVSALALSGLQCSIQTKRNGFSPGVLHRWTMSAR